MTTLDWVHAAVAAFGVAALFKFGPRILPQAEARPGRVEAADRLAATALLWLLLEFGRALAAQHPLAAQGAAWLAAGIALFVHRLLFCLPRADQAPPDLPAVPLSQRLISALGLAAAYSLALPSIYGLARASRALTAVPGEPPPQQPTLTAFRAAIDAGQWGEVLWTIALPTIIAVPLLEEVIYRAGLAAAFERMARGARLRRETLSIALSALLFALAHHGFAFAPVLAAGLLLAWIYLRTRSLFAVWAVHALHNALVLLFFAFDRGG